MSIARHDGLVRRHDHEPIVFKTKNNNSKKKTAVTAKAILTALAIRIGISWVGDER